MLRVPRRFLVLLVLALVAAFVWWALERRDVAKPAATEVLNQATSGLGSGDGALANEVAGDPRPEATPRPEGLNAADLYKEAMAIYDALSEKEKEALRKPVGAMSAEEADALFAKVETILALLQQAADEAAYCDWAMGEYRYDKPMPHIMKSMSVGLAATWGASYLFSNDQYEAAINALVAARKLGESVSDILLGLSVLTALEGRIAKSFAENVHEVALPQQLAMWNAAAGRAERMGDLFRQSMLTEAKYASSAMKAMQEHIVNDPDFADDKDFLAKVELVERRYVEILEELAEHGSSTDKAFEEWRSRAGVNALGQAIEENLNMSFAMRERLRQTQATQGMLIAGMALMQDDDAMFQATLDPATGKPFVVVETENGFELQSGYVSKNKPLSLAFPQTSGSQKKP